METEDLIECALHTLLDSIVDPQGVFYKTVLKTLRKLVPAQEVHDLAQDTMAAFVESVRSGKFTGKYDDKSVMTFLKATAKNLVLTRMLRPDFPTDLTWPDGTPKRDKDVVEPETGGLIESRGRKVKRSNLESLDNEVEVDQSTGESVSLLDILPQPATEKEEESGFGLRIVTEYMTDNPETAEADLSLLWAAAERSPEHIRANTADRFFGLSKDEDLPALAEKFGLSVRRTEARLAEIVNELQSRAKSAEPSSRFWPDSGSGVYSSTLGVKVDPTEAESAAFTPGRVTNANICNGHGAYIYLHSEDALDSEHFTKAHQNMRLLTKAKYWYEDGGVNKYGEQKNQRSLRAEKERLDKAEQLFQETWGSIPELADLPNLKQQFIRELECAVQIAQRKVDRTEETMQAARVEAVRPLEFWLHWWQERLAEAQGKAEEKSLQYAQFMVEEHEKALARMLKLVQNPLC